MDRIKYICYYSQDTDNVSRKSAPSATSKIDYIIRALNRLDIKVDLVSSAISDDPRFRFAKFGKTSLVNGNSIQYFFSLSPGNCKPIRVLNRLLVKLQLFFWLLLHLKTNETVLVYHSLGYARIINALKKIKKCTVIGEVEELYQNLGTVPAWVPTLENKIVKVYDKYLFPTVMLDNRVNTSGRPSVIIHGIYEPSRKIQNSLFADSKTHVVYAGTLDPLKGGAQAAVNAVAFLPESFHVHILGFGTEKQIDEINKLIAEVRSKGGANVSYEGLLPQARFESFLQSCQIGLSTQTPETAFRDTCFPSKILMYLCNGLNVVSARMPVIESSDVHDLVYYYDSPEPSSIAKAIIAASRQLDLKTPIERIKELDASFISQMSNILIQ